MNTFMKIGIATDHGGLDLKIELAVALENAGYEIVDFGANHYHPDDDYPDFVVPLARAVSCGEVDRGLAVCGSGVGASIAANKIKGVRAALITECYSARQGVEHDNLNLMCLGGRVIGFEMAKVLLEAFLNAEFTGEARHRRRLGKIADLESRWEKS
jgi:ribose 5-phosphate isomerase B